MRVVGIMVLGLGLGGLSCEERRASALSEAKGSPAAITPSGLRDGDVIFQESASAQSEMVRALTDSRWTHMGVVFQEKRGPFVLEAVSPVKKTALQSWIARGRGGRYVVKRLRDADTRLSPDVVDKLRKTGDAWLGRPYDLRFRWEDQSLYCSELVYKLFERGAGIHLGELERADDMNLDDERVQKALRKRFANAKFDPAETVVTPDSIFNDAELVEVKP